MPNTLLFSMIFLCQIGLISYYFPHAMARRVSYVLNHYPEDQYPKLYPCSTEKVSFYLNSYLAINYLIAVIGLALWAYFSLLSPEYQQSGKFLSHLPLIYGMVQFIPLLIAELSSYKIMQQMRLADTRTSRKAELVPRRLDQYIPLGACMLAIVLFFATFIVDWYFNGIGEEFFIKLFGMTLANAIFIFVIYFNIFGKKLDPFQANSDRFKQAKFSVQSAVAVSIFVSLFIIAQIVINAFDQHYVEIIINSLYFQFVGIFGVGSILSRYKIEDIDFSVYQEKSVS